MVETLPVNAGDIRDSVRSLGLEESVEEGMATHSGILAWRIPWTEESGGLLSMGCKESDMTERLILSLSTFIRSWSSLRNPYKVWLFLGKCTHT